MIGWLTIDKEVQKSSGYFYFYIFKIDKVVAGVHSYSGNVVKIDKNPVGVHKIDFESLRPLLHRGPLFDFLRDSSNVPEEYIATSFQPR